MAKQNEGNKLKIIGMATEDEKARKYAFGVVPHPNANDAPYYTTGDKWDDILDAFKAGYAAATPPPTPVNANTEELKRLFAKHLQVPELDTCDSYSVEWTVAAMSKSNEAGLLAIELLKKIKIWLPDGPNNIVNKFLKEIEAGERK